MLARLLLFSFCFLHFWAVQQAHSQNTFDATSKKSYRATRTTQKIKIDGILDDAAWENIPVATNFVQFSPVPFGKPLRNTEVKIIYDDDAVYIAAMLYDDPDSIRKELSQRDNDNNVDIFGVAMDCFQDGQNGFQFLVTAAGVQEDMKVGNFSCGDGCNHDTDASWDAVWQSAVGFNKNGWIVEMRLPYTALRFPKKPIQTWNFQLKRNIKRLNEKDRWSPQDPKIDNQIVSWGILNGIENIKPPLRLSFSPYFATSYAHVPNSSDIGAAYSNSKSISGGLDLKYGINESFTLDATLIPNFGQVQSDNKVLNLSPFEVRYDERRPFFTEGIELFNKGDIFYSRRVGGKPLNYYNVSNYLKTNEVITNNPSETQLYNATKITGKTNSNLGIGFFNAIAAPMYATATDTTISDTKNAERRIKTAPLTNYNVFSLDKTFNKNSEWYFLNANTWRDGDSRKANVSAAKIRLRDASDTYEYALSGRTSQVYEGDSLTSGYTADWGISKVNGSWTWRIGQSLATNKWDLNDLGIFSGNNYLGNGIRGQYSDYKPNKYYLQSQYWFNINQSFVFKPFRFQDDNINGGFYFQLKNQWGFNYNFFAQPNETIDIFEPRYDGKIFKVPATFNSNFNLRTDSRKKFILGMNINNQRTNLPDYSSWRISFYPTYKVNNHLNVGFQTRYQVFKNQQGYADDSGADNIIFGSRDRTTLDNTLSVNINFNTKSNFTFRARHYWSKVIYKDFFQLQDDGYLKPTTWNVNENINTNYFNIDAIYTLQFAPGSFLNLIWKNNISLSEYGNDFNKEDAYLKNVDFIRHIPQSNSFTLKVLYFLDYSDLKKIGRKS